MRKALKIWGETFKTLRAHPLVWLPFVIGGVFSLIAFILLYLAPQRPFSALLGPPIRAFWGGRFLHYPDNLLLLPVLFAHAQRVISAIIGVLMTGLALGLLKEIKAGSKPGVLVNLVTAFKKYFILLAIWLVVFIPATLIYRIPRWVSIDNAFLLSALPYLSLLIVIFIQAFFIYAPAAVIIERRGLFSSLKQGLGVSKNNFSTTLILLLIPTVLYIPVMLLRMHSAALMGRFFPEVVLIILGLGIVVAVIMDCVITCSAAILFLKRRKA